MERTNSHPLPAKSVLHISGAIFTAYSSLDHANALTFSELARLANLSPLILEEDSTVRDFQIPAMDGARGTRYAREPRQGERDTTLAFFGPQGRKSQSSLETDENATGLLTRVLQKNWRAK